MFYFFFEEYSDGEGTVILKSDQEPAMEPLMKEMVEARPEGPLWRGRLNKAKGVTG